MKTNVADRNVDVNVGETNEFTIKANGKAFRALISTLYENKVQSIVREIWSNALDAHIAAGNEDRPFLVTFPTMFNPTFIVRDFGVSLEHHEVMKLYTTVFESTKEDTNDATGKFGLGSKSPFAYTDTFSVCAIKDGQKRFYSAVIGKTGIPAIHFLGSEPTSEENGVEVSFPIKTDDIRAFRNAALRVSHGFSVKPEVIRGADEDPFEGWPSLPVLAEGSDWKLLRGIIEGYSAQAYAKMGPVLYPINANAIEDLEYAERELLRSTIVLEFAMGELEMTPSREALSYGSDEPTVGSIRNKLRKVLAEMVSTFQKEYDDCRTYWDACVRFRSHLSGSAPSPVLTALRKAANWNGKQLVTEMKFYDHQMPSFDVCAISGSRINNAVYRFSHTPDPTIPCSEDVTIYVDDTATDKRAASKIKYDVVSTGHSDRPKTIIWLRTYPFSGVGVTEHITAMHVFYEAIDGANIVLVSDLPDAPRLSGSGSNASGVRRNVQVRQMHGSTFETRVDVDYDDGGYYVPLERMNPVFPHNMYSPHTMFSALKEFGAIPKDAVLYGAPKSLIKKFDGDHWINIYDLAVGVFNRSKPVASLAKHSLIMAVKDSAKLRWLNDNVDARLLGDGAAKLALDYFDRVTGFTVPDVSAFIRLATAVGQHEKLAEWRKHDGTELAHHENALDVCYPLLGILRDNMRYGIKAVDKVTEYVQMCDTLSKIDSHSTDNNAARAA